MYSCLNLGLAQIEPSSEQPIWELEVVPLLAVQQLLVEKQQYQQNTWRYIVFDNSIYMYIKIIMLPCETCKCIKYITWVYVGIFATVTNVGIPVSFSVYIL